MVERIEPATLGARGGLDVLLNTWCENAGTFQGFWPIRVSTLALCALLRGARPGVHTVVVKGDIVVREETRNGASCLIDARRRDNAYAARVSSQVIMTRSKTRVAPHEWTRVPFPVKALKILLHELQSNGEAATLAAPPDVEDDDGVRALLLFWVLRAHGRLFRQGSDWEDDEKLHQGFRKDEFEYLADVLGNKAVGFDADDILADNDDEDLRSDPVSQLNIQVCLFFFLALDLSAYGGPHAGAYRRVFEGGRAGRHRRLLRARWAVERGGA
jgi:hypothetical protein